MKCILKILLLSFILKILLLSLTSLLFSLNYAWANIVNDAVVGLLQDRIGSENILLEPKYDSHTILDEVISQENKIKDITLEEMEEPKNRFRVKVVFEDDKHQFLTGQYNAFLMIPIAKRYIKFGEIIQQGDIISAKTRIDNHSDGYATSVEEVLGMQAKKYITAGRKFKLSDLALPNVIKSGDPVNLVYSSGAIMLKTVGSALSAGAVGDMIKVKNSSSGAIILGQIINKNTVKIGGDNE